MADDDLTLTISPYGYVEWRGSRARLEATQLVPPHIAWPKRIDYAHWHTDGFEFTLRRCRPDGLNGPMRGRWKNYDCWFVRRTKPRPASELMRVYAPYEELGDILFLAMRPGEALWINWSKRNGNARAEKFKARLVPQLHKRGGGRKG